VNIGWTGKGSGTPNRRLSSLVYNLGSGDILEHVNFVSTARPVELLKLSTYMCLEPGEMH
jgi:hypothetical protein